MNAVRPQVSVLPCTVSPSPLAWGEHRDTLASGCRVPGQRGGRGHLSSLREFRRGRAAACCFAMRASGLPRVCRDHSGGHACSMNATRQASAWQRSGASADSRFCLPSPAGHVHARPSWSCLQVSCSASGMASSRRPAIIVFTLSENSHRPAPRPGMPTQASSSCNYFTAVTRCDAATLGCHHALVNSQKGGSANHGNSLWQISHMESTTQSAYSLVTPATQRDCNRPARSEPTVASAATVDCDPRHMHGRLSC